MAETEPEAFARAAERLIGTPFRLHGRDPASGLDCIGLVAASLAAMGRTPMPPQGYSLRNLSIQRWLGHAMRSGLEPADGPVQRGDVLLVQPSAVQHHLLIASDPAHVVHAHAGLRRVVRQPLAHCAIISAHWRLAPPF
jgi:cell wall-associated NlpC family hydrolase